MRFRILAILLGCSLVPASACAQMTEEANSESNATAGPVAADAKKPNLPAVVDGIIERTNAFRKDEGREPVKTNEKLTETARYFADYMARTDEYGHQADDNTPAQRAKKHDYNYCLVSENIAYQYNSAGFATKELAEKFYAGWKESPGHRKNMLEQAVTETGVAIVRSDKTGYYYAVQLFGRPKSAAITFKIENQSGEAVEYTLGDQSFTLEPRYTRTHTMCRPAELTPAWPGGAKAEAVTPENGDTFTVVKDGDTFRLTN